MATIVTRAGKGTPLTNTEVDNNFTNLNSDKVETSAVGTIAAQNANNVNITGGTITGVSIPISGLPVANTSEWRSNTADKLLDTDVIWGAMSEVVLTDGVTISWDMSSGFDFITTLGGNRTFANPTNTKVGQKGRLLLQQDGTGSRTITWGSNYKFAGGIKPTLSTTANSVDALYYDVRSSTYIIVSLAGKAFA